MMRFSEAVVTGAKLRPQTTGEFFREAKSCVLGAAYEAYFGVDNWDADAYDTAFERMCEVWALLETKGHVCPVVDCELDFTPDTDDLYDLCWHLNDGHKWSREAIAAWYAGSFEQESKQESKAA